MPAAEDYHLLLVKVASSAVVDGEVAICPIDTFTAADMERLEVVVEAGSIREDVGIQGMDPLVSVGIEHQSRVRGRFKARRPHERERLHLLLSSYASSYVIRRNLLVRCCW